MKKVMLAAAGALALGLGACGGDSGDDDPTLTVYSGRAQQLVGPLLERFEKESGVKLGQVAQPLRAALTGKTTSPGLFDVMAVLGREEVLARLADAA